MSQSNKKITNPKLYPVRDTMDKEKICSYKVTGTEASGFLLTLTDKDDAIFELSFAGASFDDMNDVVSYIRSRII